MSKRNPDAERQYWLQTKALGKNRFIWREVLWSLPQWFFVVLGVELLGDHTHSFSMRSAGFSWLLTLPIFLLGGYLSAGWKWKDFEKKYPE